jgi:hypothetical protein
VQWPLFELAHHTHLPPAKWIAATYPRTHASINSSIHPSMDRSGTRYTVISTTTTQFHNSPTRRACALRLILAPAAAAVCPRRPALVLAPQRAPAASAQLYRLLRAVLSGPQCEPLTGRTAVVARACSSRDKESL